MEHDFLPEVGDGVRFGEPAFEKAIAHREKEGDFGLGCGLAHVYLFSGKARNALPFAFDFDSGRQEA
ncbi:MAG: hypothetical protein DKT66_09735 [Candidatus Melainabacteria bacterium]|nr:MAG: hypothetical protein DKT66_09735 [Candidatus Melainabacteria bacterium]